MAEVLSRLFFAGFVRLHVLYQAAQEPICGVGVVAESPNGRADLPARHHHLHQRDEQDRQRLAGRAGREGRRRRSRRAMRSWSALGWLRKTQPAARRQATRSRCWWHGSEGVSDGQEVAKTGWREAETPPPAPCRSARPPGAGRGDAADCRRAARPSRSGPGAHVPGLRGGRQRVSGQVCEGRPGHLPRLRRWLRPAGRTRPQTQGVSGNQAA